MRAALNKCKDKNLDYILTSLDAQKAYDSVDHTYILKTLEAYNFPTEFIATIDILNSNMIAQVQVNGFLSESFSLSRSKTRRRHELCSIYISH